MQLDYTVPTQKSFHDAVEAVTEAAMAYGFTCPFVNTLSVTLAQKGFPREPLTIVEVCNARHASAVLERDVLIGLMFPCPVMVFEKDGEVFISTMRPSIIGSFYPEADVGAIADEVEKAIFGIVDEAAA